MKVLSKIIFTILTVTHMSAFGSGAASEAAFPESENIKQGYADQEEIPSAVFLVKKYEKHPIYYSALSYQKKDGSYSKIDSIFHRKTALEKACENNHVDMVKYLLSAGANVNAPTLERTPLHIALSAGYVNPELIEMLLRYGADMNKVDDIRRTSIGLLTRALLSQEEIITDSNGQDSLVESGRIIFNTFIHHGAWKHEQMFAQLNKLPESPTKSDLIRYANELKEQAEAGQDLKESDTF